MQKNEIMKALDEIVKETVDVNFIMAMPKIKELLEFIVKTPELVGMISNCMKDIDYRQEFVKSIHVSQSGKEFLELPESPRFVISVIIGLLYDIDKDNTILSVLMNRFSPEKNVNISYTNFIFSILKPFSDAIKQLLNFDDNSLAIEDKFDAVAAKITPELVLQTVSPIIKEINTMIHGDNKLKDNESRDLTIIVNGLYQAISISDPILIKSAYLSILLIMDLNRKYRNLLSKLTKEMTRYALI